jgi:hypothetical protein
VPHRDRVGLIAFNGVRRWLTRPGNATAIEFVNQLRNQLHTDDFARKFVSNHRQLTDQLDDRPRNWSPYQRRDRVYRGEQAQDIGQILVTRNADRAAQPPGRYPRRPIRRVEDPPEVSGTTKHVGCHSPNWAIGERIAGELVKVFKHFVRSLAPEMRCDKVVVAITPKEPVGDSATSRMQHGWQKCLFDCGLIASSSSHILDQPADVVGVVVCANHQVDVASCEQRPDMLAEVAPVATVDQGTKRSVARLIERAIALLHVVVRDGREFGGAAGTRIVTTCVSRVQDTGAASPHQTGI